MKNIFSAALSILRKGIVATLCTILMSLFVTVGCDKPIINQNDSISSNLLKKGNIDPVLLIGEWNCLKFAYTPDGNVIADVTTISKGHFNIPNMEERWIFIHTNEILYNHSICRNLIKFTMNGSTFVNSPPEEDDITSALSNACSFIIREDEFIIYFTGTEGKNLLILKKQMP